VRVVASAPLRRAAPRVPVLPSAAGLLALPLISFRMRPRARAGDRLPVRGEEGAILEPTALAAEPLIEAWPDLAYPDIEEVVARMPPPPPPPEIVVRIVGALEDEAAVEMYEDFGEWSAVTLPAPPEPQMQIGRTPHVRRIVQPVALLPAMEIATEWFGGFVEE
jgi:hypothetical protein